MQCVWLWNEQSKHVVGSKGLMSVIFVEYSVTLSYVMILQLSNLRVTILLILRRPPLLLPL
jgi:hypothetical protein